MCTEYYRFTDGTRILPQPNGAFIYSRRLNTFDVTNETGREVILEMLRGACLCSVVERIHKSVDGHGEGPVAEDVGRFLGTLTQSGYILKTDEKASRGSGLDCVELGSLGSDLKMVYAVVDLTNRCNQECRYCYAETQRHAIDLTASDWIRALKALHGTGLRAVVLSGGEPLMHKAFWEILEFCSNHFIVEVNTNAQLIYDEEARRLAAYGLKVVQVSIDSLDPLAHDAYRGAGTWARAIQATSLLRGHQVPVRISMTVRPETMPHVEPLRQYACERGFAFNAIGIKKAGRARSLDSEIWSQVPQDQPEVMSYSECERFEVRCGGMVGFAAIASDGRLKACNMPPSFFSRIGGGLDDETILEWGGPRLYGNTRVGASFVAIQDIGTEEVDRVTRDKVLEYPNCILEKYCHYRATRPHEGCL